jgi:hypothetical protein
MCHDRYWIANNTNHNNLTNGLFGYDKLLIRNMINKINKERRRSMNATPTWPSDKNKWQGAQADHIKPYLAYSWLVCFIELQSFNFVSDFWEVQINGLLFFGRRPSDFTLTSAKINSEKMNIGRIFIGHFNTNSLFDWYFRRASVIGRSLFDCSMARSVEKRNVRIDIKTQLWYFQDVSNSFSINIWN